MWRVRHLENWPSVVEHSASLSVQPLVSLSTPPPSPTPPSQRYQVEHPTHHLSPSGALSGGIDNFQREEYQAKANCDDVLLLRSFSQAEILPHSTAMAEANDGASFIVAAAAEKARSSGAAIFDRAWLNDIKLGCRSHDVAGARSRHTCQLEPNASGSVGKRTFGGGEVNNASLATSAVNASQGSQGSHHFDGGSVMEAPYRELEGGETGGGDCDQGVETVLAYPRWRNENGDVLVPAVWGQATEVVLRQTAGDAARSVPANSFKRPWHPSQWNHFQILSNAGGN